MQPFCRSTIAKHAVVEQGEKGGDQCLSSQASNHSFRRTALYCGSVIFLCAWTILHALAVAQGITVRDVIQTKEISSLSISPDDRYLAFLIEARHVAANSIQLTWYVKRLGPKPGELTMVADGGVPIRSLPGPALMERPIWSPDSRWIAFRARRHGEVQVWRASRGGGEVEQVTHDAADVESFVLGRHGSLLFYTVYATRRVIEDEERREYQQGVLLNGTLAVEEPVLYNWRRDDGTKSTVRWGQNGRYQLLCNGKPRVRVLSLADLGSGRPATATEIAEYKKLVGPSGMTSIMLSSVPGQIVLPERRGAEVAFWERPGPSSMSAWLSDYQLTVSTGGEGHTIQCKAQGCRALIFEMNAPQWRPGADEVVWVSASEVGAGTVHVWNTRSNAVRTAFSSGARLGGTGGADRYYETGCPITAREAVCVVSGSSSPPQIEAINLDTGAAHVLYDPNGSLRKMAFGRAQYLNWKDKWGRRHEGVLVLPLDWKQGQRLPLIITSYTCSGFLEGANNRTVPEFVLVESGFAALCTVQDLRLQDMAYPDKSVGPGFDLRSLQVMLDTWESGVKALERRGLIDPTRIGISGLSFSSEAVWYALTHSNLFTAAVTGGPYDNDPFDYFIMKSELAGHASLSLRDLPDPTTRGARAFYEKASVALNAEKISTPILEQSIGAEYREGLETYVEMDRAKKPYEVFVFAKEFHQRVQPQHLAVIQERNIAWFRFWLQGYEDPTPSLRRQYARWERLCVLQRGEKGAHPTACVTGASPRG